MYQQIKEGNANILIPKETHVSKKLTVFYNPAMELNRTISILLLNSLNKKDMLIADPLAGTGVRSIRFLKELNKGIIKNISLNDINNEAVNIIKKNFEINNNKQKTNNKNKTKSKRDKKITISNKDANLFLLESFGFDYIDIDPFGSPNIFLDSAIKRLARDGILAVTATDTGALSGSFPDACKRKYWATPKKNETMHENGLRILIRKMQLIGADHEKALIPIYSYSKEHYMRVFFRCEKGRQKVDTILKQHGLYNGAGPLWLGQLWDKTIAKKIYQEYKKQYKKEENEIKFLKTIAEESNINTVGFFNLPKICKKYKLIMIKQDEIIKRIKKLGYKVALTHFAPNSLRSDISEKELLKVIL